MSDLQQEYSPTQIASLWRRLAALFYDCFIIGALAILYAGIATAIAVQLGVEQTDDYQLMIKGHWYEAGLVLTIMLYYCYCWYKKGQTIGMKTWRIQTISADPQQTTLGFKHCLIRSVAGGLGFFLMGIGYWYSFFNRDRHSLHDVLSGTVVVFVPKEKK